jgi:hypothetical protein
MSSIDRGQFGLWDYGWLDHSEVHLDQLKLGEDAVDAYLRSDDFATSFILPTRDVEPSIHGPFLRGALSKRDFDLVTPEQFRAQVATIRQPKGFFEPASDQQWEPIEKLVSDLSQGSVKIFALQRTEADKSLFHDWGFVLHIFREFVCVSPNPTVIDRLVFGYD